MRCACVIPTRIAFSLAPPIERPTNSHTLLPSSSRPSHVRGFTHQLRDDWVPYGFRCSRLILLLVTSLLNNAVTHGDARFFLLLDTMRRVVGRDLYLPTSFCHLWLFVLTASNSFQHRRHWDRGKSLLRVGLARQSSSPTPPPSVAPTALTVESLSVGFSSHSSRLWDRGKEHRLWDRDKLSVTHISLLHDTRHS